MSRLKATATLILVALLAGGAACAEEDEDGRFEKRVTADPQGVVEVSNVAGTVIVRGWDRSEVDVRAEFEEDVERIDVVSEGKRTRIKVVLPRGSKKRGNDREAYLEIRMPEGSELDVGTVSAEIETHGVVGRQRLKSVSGDIGADLAAADVEVKTVSGDVVLRGRGRQTSVRASTVSGNLTLDRGAGAIDATTVSGDLIVELEPAKSVRVRTTSGDLSLSGRLEESAEVIAETVSGELTARLAGSGFDYEVTSFSGDIDTCFKNKAEPMSEYGPGLRLAGKHGNGRGTLRMKTMSGDVELCGR